MKKITIILLLLAASFFGYSQNVKQGTDGNYYPIAKTDTGRTETATKTDKFYTDSKGLKYPVYISVKGKLFVYRTSRNGNKYKFYLKP